MEKEPSINQTEEGREDERVMRIRERLGELIEKVESLTEEEKREIEDVWYRRVFRETVPLPWEEIIGGDKDFISSKKELKTWDIRESKNGTDSITVLWDEIPFLVLSEVDNKLAWLVKKDFYPSVSLNIVGKTVREQRERMEKYKKSVYATRRKRGIRPQEGTQRHTGRRNL